MKKIKIEITQAKIKGCEDSFFYEGEVATATKPNGTILSLLACGDIRININEDSYRNGNLDEAIDKYKLTDKKLKQLEAKGKLTWENNNWFEVVWKKRDNDSMDCDIGNVAYDYDSAIILLKSYFDDEEY